MAEKRNFQNAGRKTSIPLDRQVEAGPRCVDHASNYVYLRAFVCRRCVGPDPSPWGHHDRMHRRRDLNEPEPGLHSPSIETGSVASPRKITN